MNAIKFLKSQHREVEALFKKIEATKDRPATYKDRRALVTEISNKLILHTKIEETILYPKAKKVDDDMTLEAYEEHDCVKSVIKKLAKTRTNDETFMAKVTVLKELVEHHVEEEEETYFPELEKAWSKEQLEELGEQLQMAFEKLEGKVGSRVPQLTLIRAS